MYLCLHEHNSCCTFWQESMLPFNLCEHYLIRSCRRVQRAKYEVHFARNVVEGNMLKHLVWQCRITMLATYLSAVLALLLLWNVYPKDFNYGAAAGNGLLFYNANVSHLFLMPPSSSLMNSTCFHNTISEVFRSM